jgi:ribosomal protein S18 acetylase RimI-like enzyme
MKNRIERDAVIIREARPDELADVGDLRVAAYVADGFLAETSAYAPRLRSLGTDGAGQVLVAVIDGAIVGTIMVRGGPDSGEIVQGPDEAEIRALAVAKEAQGRGVGQALLRTVIEQTAARGIRHLVLSTQPDMRTAHRLYERAGFRRLPERDWTPQPGVDLIAYGLRLDQPGGSADLAGTADAAGSPGGSAADVA